MQARLGTAPSVPDVIHRVSIAFSLLVTYQNIRKVDASRFYRNQHLICCWCWIIHFTYLNMVTTWKNNLTHIEEKEKEE
jgi:hypothetical protein